MNNEIKLKDMIDFLENVYKDIKKQPTLEEEQKQEKEFINKIKGNNTNEIKEILNNFKEHLEKNYQSYLGGAVDSTEYYMSCGDLKLLLDYITNLQEKNKELNDDNIWWNNRFKAVERDNRNLKAKLEMYENGVYFSSENDELQERIDKAIECINYYAIENSDYEKIYNIEEETLLNILGGKNG